MAVTDGSGPRPAPHRAKRCFLNCLETSFNPCFFLPSARVQGPCRRPQPAPHPAKRCFLNCLETSFNPCFFLPSARVQGPCRRPQTPWQWRTDRARGRQMDGSGPRPAAHRAKRRAKRCFLNCLETSINPGFFLPSARVQGPCRRPQTPWQWRTERAHGRHPIVPNVAFSTA